MSDPALCTLCPRRCSVDRGIKPGFCGVPSRLLIARAAPHYDEEPCISGTRGSGAVFLSGCNLRCIYCQNHQISRGAAGQAVSMQEAIDILHRLEDSGVHNIELVTPSHYSRLLAEVLCKAQLHVPVIWNSSAYETAEQLRELEGLVQIYLPDMKYRDPALSASLSSAPDYPAVAEAAILEMFRQRGPYRMDESGMLRSGVLIRHLVLPGYIDNSLRVIDWVEDRFEKGSVLFSLLSQYTPMPELVRRGIFSRLPSLARRITKEEYERVQDYLFFSSVEDGFIQDPASAQESYVPAFDGSGVSG